MNANTIKVEIRYLTPEEGGRKRPVGICYRGQFHYGDELEASDGFQYFPKSELQDGFIPLGKTVFANVFFPEDRWRDYHVHRLNVGLKFKIREGSKIVGEGSVLSLSEDPWDKYE